MQTDDKIHHETTKFKCVLFALFPNNDIQMECLITSCIALQFTITIELNITKIEKLIRTNHYEMIIIDTRSHTSSTILNLLNRITNHTENSYIIALWSPQAGIDNQSKLHFIFSLLKSGVDRILQETDHILSYFAQLLFIKEIDLNQQQEFILAERLSSVVNHLSQPIKIVNQQFNILYQNTTGENFVGGNEQKVGNNIFENFGGSESTIARRMRHQLTRTKHPWKWKPIQHESRSMIFIPLNSSNDNTHASKIDTKNQPSPSFNSRFTTKIIPTNRNHFRLNNRYIKLLHNARNNLELQTIIKQIAIEFNFKGKLTTVNDLIQIFGKNTFPRHLNIPDEQIQVNDVDIHQRYFTNLSIEIRRQLNLWNTWDFDLIRIESMLGSMTLFYTAMQIFLYFQIEKILHCKNEILINWFLMISRNYYDLPYHNIIHVTDVLQAASFYLINSRCLRIFNELEIAAILISCLCHDIQHPGRTNTYLVNRCDPLALLYNDQTILENHHASVTFRLTMNSLSVNIFSNLSNKDFHYIRSNIIDSILVTDIAKHFKYIQRFSMRDKNQDDIFIHTIEHNHLSSLDRNSITNREQSNQSLTHTKKIDHFKTNVRRMIMKNADLSNSTRPNHIAYTWATRIAEELFRQTEYEKENNLTLTNDIFTRETCNLAQTQIAFYDLFMHNMLIEWVEFTELSILKENFDRNYTYWKKY